MIEDIERQAKQLSPIEQRQLGIKLLKNADEIEAIERGLREAKEGLGTDHEDVMRELRARIDAAV